MFQKRAARLAAMLVAVFLSHALHAADPALLVVDPLQVKITTGSEPLAFMVYTTEGTLSNLNVRVTELKDPDGKAMTPLFVVSPATATVTPGGVLVTLTPKNPRDFDRLGEYHAAIQLTAMAGAGKKAKAVTPLIKAATLTRVKPALTIEGLRNTAVRVSRACPFAGGTATIPATLRNASGATLDNVTITADPVTTTGDPAEAVKASVTTDAGTSVDRGGKPLNITVTSDTPGVLQSHLRVRVNGEETDDIPFKIVVRDQLYLPLLAIFLGVFIAFLLNYFANRLKPEHENRLRLSQLQQRVARLRLRTADHSDKTESLMWRLNDAAAALAAADAATTKTALDTLATELAELEKTVETEQQTARQKVRDVRAKIDALRGTGVDETALNNAATLLASIEAMLAERRYLDATAELTPLEAQVAAIQPPARRGGRPDEDAIAGLGAAAPSPYAIRVVTSSDARVALRQIVLELTGDLPAGTTLRWDFGDGETESTTKSRVKHTYASSNTYSVTVEAGDITVTGEVGIAPSQPERDVADAAKRVRNLDLLLSGFALVIATVTGVLILYADKNFGTLTQYCEAFLWGFGIDGSVRGFSNVLKKLVSNG